MNFETRILNNVYQENNFDLIKDIIGLGFDTYPTKDPLNANVNILVPFNGLDRLVAVLKKHQNQRSIIWHGNPIVDSKIEFIISGISYLPVLGIIEPKPFYNLIKDYYDVVLKKDKEAFKRLNTELTSSLSNFSLGSSANFGLDALADPERDYDGEIKIQLRFNLDYFNVFNNIVSDKDHITSIEDDDSDDLLELENRDLQAEFESNKLLEEEENYQALLEETLIAQQISNEVKEGNFEDLLAATSAANAHHYNEHLDDQISGFGIVNLKNSKKVINTFRDNINNLIYYYPDESQIYKLVDCKNKILNFLTEHFKKQ